MKPTYILALLVAQIAYSVGEPAVPQVPQPRLDPPSASAPRAWLGLQVVKPDETITAHVPSLPRGIGFVVKSIDKGGPAQTAGLAEFDLLWKLGDQMLVNEAQLATLLRLSKPGEEVVISGFRAGKPLEVKLKLGHSPVPQRPFFGEMVESAILPGACPGPMRMVNVAEKTASFSSDDGSVQVRRHGDGYHVKIEGIQNETVFEGDISNGDSLDRVPENWHRRIRVLCRTLDQALEGNSMTQRQPRPRVVPPPSAKP